MAFSNRIRLPFKLHKPQFPEEATRYRKANGQSVTLSVVVRKVYEGLTDRLPEKLHERLKIALVHDRVEVEGDKYVGVITQDGDYQIEWQDFLSHPLAQAKFKAEVTPFNATNSNCGTCQEMIQVVANDDNAGILAENDTYTINVLANDDICCNPVTLTLVTFDSNYLTSATVNGNNEIVIHTQSSLPDLDGVQILTYRVQCQNGQYDEAFVFADLDGSVIACAPPTGLSVTGVDETHATINYTPAVGVVLDHFQVRTMPDNTVVQDGNQLPDNHVDLSGLSPGQSYRFYIQSNCGGGNFSPYVWIDFTTDSTPPADSCGSYDLYNTDDLNYRQGSYIDCLGEFRGLNIPPSHTRRICVLQNSPGVPVELNVEPEIAITYNGIC